MTIICPECDRGDKIEVARTLADPPKITQVWCGRCKIQVGPLPPHDYLFTRRMKSEDPTDARVLGYMHLFQGVMFMSVTSNLGGSAKETMAREAMWCLWQDMSEAEREQAQKRCQAFYELLEER